MPEAGHQGPQPPVDRAAAGRGPLPAPGEAEEPQRGERVDLQRLVPQLAQGRGDPFAAPGEDFQEGGRERRDAHARQLALEMAAAGAGVVAAGAVVVQAAAAQRPGQGRVDRHRPPPARPPGQVQDLRVVAGRGQQLVATAAQDGHPGLAVRHPGQVDPHADPGALGLRLDRPANLASASTSGLRLTGCMRLL